MRPQLGLEAGGSGARTTRIGGAEPFVGIGIDADRFCEAYPAGFDGECVPASFEFFRDFRREIGFE